MVLRQGGGQGIRSPDCRKLDENRRRPPWALCPPRARAAAAAGESPEGWAGCQACKASLGHMLQANAQPGCCTSAAGRTRCRFRRSPLTWARPHPSPRASWHRGRGSCTRGEVRVHMHAWAGQKRASAASQGSAWYDAPRPGSTKLAFSTERQGALLLPRPLPRCAAAHTKSLLLLRHCPFHPAAELILSPSLELMPTLPQTLQSRDPRFASNELTLPRPPSPLASCPQGQGWSRAG